MMQSPYSNCMKGYHVMAHVEQQQDEAACSMPLNSMQHIIMLYGIKLDVTKYFCEILKIIWVRIVWVIASVTVVSCTECYLRSALATTHIAKNDCISLVSCIVFDNDKTAKWCIYFDVSFSFGTKATVQSFS